MWKEIKHSQLKKKIFFYLTRCENSGQLSVTLLSTGATAMTYRAGVILSAQNLQLTSQLYIGGLPTGYVVNIRTCIQKKATKIDVVHVNTFF